MPEPGAPLEVLDQEGGPGTGSAMNAGRDAPRGGPASPTSTRAEGIDCGYAKGGPSGSPPTAQLRRLRRRFAQPRAARPRRRLPAARPGRDQARSTPPASRRPSSRRTPPPCIRPGWRAVWPAPSSGWAATLDEQTPALRIEEPPGGQRRRTWDGVTAEIVVRATEGYTSSLAGYAGTIISLGNRRASATEPIPAGAVGPDGRGQARAVRGSAGDAAPTASAHRRRPDRRGRARRAATSRGSKPPPFPRRMRSPRGAAEPAGRRGWSERFPMPRKRHRRRYPRTARVGRWA